MKLYKTTITPQSNFSTALKGDTLFGQMCWAVRYAFGNERLKSLLNNYATEPFLIVSDGFARGYLPKPSMPGRYLNEDPDQKKQNRKRVWLSMDALKKGHYAEAKTDKDIGNVKKRASVVRNAINYKSSTTGGKGFDPYGEDETALSEQEIYFLVSDAFGLDELKEAFALLSGMGYGKDSSIGKGRFEVGEFTELPDSESASTFMALSPFAPSNLQNETLFYEPFTRFGKSGAARANTHPFKKPILLADCGAVIHFAEKKVLHYVGQAIVNISSYDDTVHQGYAIVLPIKELPNGS